MTAVQSTPVLDRVVVGPPAGRLPDAPGGTGPLRSRQLPVWRRPGALHTDRWSVLGLMVAVAVVTGIGSGRFPGLADDEGTYVAQAWSVRHGALAHYTYWYDHPPFGWLQLAALGWLPSVLHLGGGAVADVRLVMVAVAVLNVPLLFSLARRLRIGRVVSLVCTALYAFSPLTITLSRQVYLDSLAVPWVLGAFVLALSPRRHQWHQVAAGAVFAGAVLTKETTVVLLPALVWVLLRAAGPRMRAMTVTSFAIPFTLLASLYPLFAALRRELVPGPGHVSLVGALQFQLFSRAGSGSLWDAGSARHDLVADWIGQDRWLIGLGLVGALLALTWRPGRPITLALLLLAAPVIKPGGYLPAMYVTVALPLLALAAAAGATAVAVRLRDRRGAAVAVGAVAAVGLGLAVVPSYVVRDAAHMTTDVNTAHRSAGAFVAASVPRTATVMVDDSYWVDLVDHGWKGQWDGGAVWYYKLDLDSAATTEMPGGWRDVDYVVVSQQLRQDLTTQDLPETALAVRNSTLIASFGTRSEQVDVREVNNGRAHPKLPGYHTVLPTRAAAVGSVPKTVPTPAPKTVPTPAPKTVPTAAPGATAAPTTPPPLPAAPIFPVFPSGTAVPALPAAVQVPITPPGTASR